ncbi:MAG: hypothetical protein ACYC2P_09715 [Paludibacteraceae bacterium]
MNYSTFEFGIIKVDIKALKSIQIANKLSLPEFGLLDYNPTAKDAFLVAEIAF